MLFLKTGLPGGGKSLNTIKEIVENPSNSRKEKYYNNIKLFLLDIDVCNSFSGWFYGVFYEELPLSKKPEYDKIIKTVHQEQRFVIIDDVPWLKAQFKNYSTEDALLLFLKWVRRLYPKENLIPLERLYQLTDTPTVEQVKTLNYHFNYFDDATEWYNLPSGALILIDECQDFFPPKSNSATRPKHYSKFQTHRHSGHDVYLVTQDPLFLDYQVRCLAGNHVHLYRPFASKYIVRYEHDAIFQINNGEDKKKCRRSTIKRDSNFYGVYWSADEHTHKAKIPKKIFIFIPFLILFLSMVGYILSGGLGDVIGGGKKEDIKSSSTNRPINKSTSKPIKAKTSSIEMSYIGSKKFTHPLDSMCKTFEYGGYNTIMINDIYQTEHFINCDTDELKTVTFRNEDGTSFSEQHPITRTLSSFYLKELGYKIALNNRTPIVIYNKQKLIMNMF
jgi:zona occludens toxin